MVVIGLTGGIGAGKSTVAEMLEQRGAAIIDADRIAREVVEPGRPAYDAVVARFGPPAVASDGTLDRPALAALVFGDDDARRDLEAITHPAIQAEMASQMLALAEPERVVVLDIPLLKEKRAPMAGIIVVDVPEDVAVGRLVAHRGFEEADARARIAAQISRQTRRALADVIIDNSGDRSHLESQVDQAWAWATALEVPAP